MGELRPKIDLPYGKWEWICEAVAAGALLLCFTLPVAFWNALPDELPGHFDAAGNVTRNDPKAVPLILLPTITLGLYALLTFFSRIPHLYNYPWPITPANAEKQYRGARMMILALKAVIPIAFALILWQTIQVGLGETNRLSPLVMVVLLLGTFGVTGVGVVVLSLRR